jgi:hypothetical protein
MGLLSELLSNGIGAPALTGMVKKRYGKLALSPQMGEVDELLTKVRGASIDQISEMPKLSSDIEVAFPGNDGAFDGVFAAVIASDRLDPVCDCQDRIGALALKRIDKKLSTLGYDNGFAIVAIQALTALYMRDWLDREITDVEFERFNKPPYFEIKKRIFTKDDYLLVVAPWVSVFGKIHPGD